MVAIKVLRRFDEDNPGRQGLLLLANVLVAGFEPFQNAPVEIMQESDAATRWATRKTDGYERKLTALEVAIVSESKSFLASTASQKVVDAIYRGRIVYTPTSFLDILPDHYKHRPISLYDPSQAPLLNQYRLIVPRTRNFLDIWQFVLLLVLYILVMTKRNGTDFTSYELVFCVYTFGWILEEIASILEHGWQVYTQNLWAFLDAIFVVLYGAYFILRVHGLLGRDNDASNNALMLLATAAPILIPRLAFNLMSENMLFVSLRAMMADFTFLSALAVWCFAGFLLAMRWLSPGLHKSITISKWMLWVWFGLDATGIQRSVEFHWLLGPILMVAFAFLGNTLFLTILVSMLSNTFAIITSNATAEIQFRRTVLTFEGVKSDAIFAYQPPFNIAALVILLPLKFILSPRWFHKINAATVRMINAPLLVAICLYERKSLWAGSQRKPGAKKPQETFASLKFPRFSAHGDIQAVFDIEPPQSVIDKISNGHELRGRFSHHLPIKRGNHRNESYDSSNRKAHRAESMASFNGVPGQLSEILQEHSDLVIKPRFEAMDQSIQKIESLLQEVSERISKV